METIDWTSFTRRISINADSNSIYQYWSSQTGLEEWFLSKAEFQRESIIVPRNQHYNAGDTYTWMWHGSDSVAEGEVLENNGSNQIGFTFLGCKVEVKILSEGEVQVVELKQYDIPIDETSKMKTYVECTRGWTFYLANLKSILEGGVDLRNKDASVKNVIST